MISNELRLKGRCDYILKEGNLFIPLELKRGSCIASEPFNNDVMQLMCYILLIENTFKTKCPHGYILYLGSKQRIKVKTSLTLRRSVQVCFNSIRSYQSNKKIPNRLEQKNCGVDCPYYSYCWCG